MVAHIAREAGHLVGWSNTDGIYVDGEMVEGTPGDAVAPGIVGLICGVSLVIAGVALIVLVMRHLLAQAVALDSETKHLQAELDAVI